MYCQNCGSKNVEGAKFCTSCGKKINETKEKEAVTEKTTIIVKEQKKYSGFDIASLVLGIIGCIYAFLVLVGSSEISISSYDYYYYGMSYLIGYIIGVVLFQVIFATLSLIFAIVGKKKNKNGINIAGLVLAIVTFAFSALTILVVLS